MKCHSWERHFSLKSFFMPFVVREWIPVLIKRIFDANFDSKMSICVQNLLQDFVKNALYPEHLVKTVLVKLCTFRDLLALAICYSCCMVSPFVSNTFLLPINTFLCCKRK